jgi:hypothetical protein
MIPMVPSQNFSNSWILLRVGFNLIFSITFVIVLTLGSSRSPGAQLSPTRPKLPPKFAQFNAALSVPTLAWPVKGLGGQFWAAPRPPGCLRWTASWEPDLASFAALRLDAGGKAP